MIKDKGLKNIFIVSLIITIIFPVIYIFFIYPSFSNLLVENTQEDAIRIAEHFSHKVLTEDNELKDPSEFAHEAEDLKEQLKLVKLKVFSDTGEIIYSTDPEDIGEINKNDYFWEIVVKGDTYSKVVKKEAQSLEGQNYSSDVMEIYVPLMVENRFIGAFEIYYDITARDEKLNNILFISNIIPFFIMLTFLVLIFVILFNSDKNIIKREKAEKELQKHRDKLEEQVNERTKSLIDTNNEFISEIKERRRVEEALKGSEESLIMAQEVAQIGSWDWDILKDELKWSNEVYRQFGLKPKEIKPSYQAFEKFVDPRDIDLVNSEVKKALDEDKPYSVQARMGRADGSEWIMQAQGRVYRDDNGKAIRFVGTQRDISEQIATEEAMRQSEEKYRTLVENIDIGITLIDTDHNILYTNSTVGKMLNKSPEEFIGKKCYAEFEKKDQPCPYCPGIKAIETGKSQEVISEGMRDDGSKFFVRDRAFPFFNEQGKIIAFHEVVEDITDQVNAEESLKRYAQELEESNQMKELFSDILSHDLLNPIGIIKNISEIRLEDDPDGDEDFKTILRNSQKTLDLIENARMLSKLESDQEINFEDLDLKDILENTSYDLELLFNGAGIQLVNNIKSSMPIKANVLLEHLFINLLTNAIKYAKEGKKVVIDGEELSESYKISLTDFGPGIPDKDKKDIFTRFRRTYKGDIKGSGLGLTIVKKLVEMHNGKIWIEDNPESGAVFIVELPKVPYN